MIKYTAEDVKNIFETLADEFLVDIPADHSDGKYRIELVDLILALTDSEPEWFEEISHVTNLRVLPEAVLSGE